MKYLIFGFSAAVVMTGLANAALADNAPPFDKQAVLQKCQSEWADDFNMQKFCLDQNTQGHADFADIFATLPTGKRVTPAILNRCRAEWEPDWNMAAFCANQNLKGEAELENTLTTLPAKISAKIDTKCTGDWPTDITMQAFCIGQQALAWRELNK